MDTAAQSPSQRSKNFQLNAASIPFFLAHLACFAAFYTGVGVKEVVVCIGLYYARMIAVTMGYHRYFSHRTFQTGRVFQFLMAVAATTAAQKGPLWWAAHHRHHHKESDQPDDIHSPVQRGFYWSHVGWILATDYNETKFDQIKDFARYPELRWLNTWHLVPPIALAAGLFFWGGLSMLVWGFFISTVLLWHGTFTINSLSHVFGKRRYKSSDDSRNNLLLALITCGEGWHNNHHYHQNTANQGWFWWEVDLTYYVLVVLSWFRIVTKLRTPSDAVKFAHLKYTAEERAELQSKDRKTISSIAAAKMRGAVSAAGEKLSSVGSTVSSVIHADAFPRAGASPQPVVRR